ncbi:hypothetical protein [Sutterella sp.]|uniref:hypothetical protein n=1 Tax=Sutterella sp. TaxID=1981025 RepID=UPI0026DF8C87|nr:hypothetical protein [Sutterella sp.]MDO5532921.1 hypothetical protein [Sutterella sp.]
MTATAYKPPLPDDAVPEPKDLTRGVLASWTLPLKRFGGSYTKTLVAFRQCALMRLPWFAKAADRAFLPVSGFVAMRKRELIDRGAPPELLADFDRHAPQIIHSLVSGAWAVEKICVGFSKSVSRAVLENQGWWRDFPCDWLLERYRAMSIYIAIPEDDLRDDFGGYLTGLTIREDGPALYFQYVHPSGMTLPEMYGEIPLRRGVKLGRIQEVLRYDHFAFDVLAHKDELSAKPGEPPFRERMTEAVRVSAAVVLPLLIAALGDEFDRRCLDWHPSSDTATELGSNISFHQPGMSDEEMLNAMSCGTVRIVEITKPTARDLN